MLTRERIDMTPNRYLYFPGCSLKSSGAAYEKSLLALFRQLELPLSEMEDWNCCGATSYMSIDECSAFTLSARNLQLAATTGIRDLVAPCSACYLVLKKTQDYYEQYTAIREEVDHALDNRTGPIGSVRVRHPLEVLYTDVGPDRIKTKVVRKWEGGKFACYYGCQAVRPYHEVDRPHDPLKMDELLHACGIPTVEYALKTKCCGGSLTGTVHEVGLRLTYLLIKEAARKGAEGIVTMCPLCQFNLDVYQKEMRGDAGQRYDVPVLSFTQVIAWALGVSEPELGLSMSISGRRIIEQWFCARAGAANA